MLPDCAILVVLFGAIFVARKLQASNRLCKLAAISDSAIWERFVARCRRGFDHFRNLMQLGGDF